MNLAARVMGEAGPGDIVVSAGVTHTTAGGQFRFEDLGTRTLEGIEQSLQLFAVELEQ